MQGTRLEYIPGQHARAAIGLEVVVELHAPVCWYNECDEGVSESGALTVRFGHVGEMCGGVDGCGGVRARECEMERQDDSRGSSHRLYMAGGEEGQEATIYIVLSHRRTHSSGRRYCVIGRIRRKAGARGDPAGTEQQRRQVRRSSVHSPPDAQWIIARTQMARHVCVC